MSFLCYPLFSPLQVAQHVSGNHAPIFRSWWLSSVSPCVGIVPWLQEGCQNQLAGCDTNSSMDTLPANRFWQPSCSHGTKPTCGETLLSRQLLKMGTWLPETCWAICKGEIKDNTKVTSSWLLIHTELQCTVNHTSDLLCSCWDKICKDLLAI